jgi:alkanesulfonate monooxygenase SsuD/methylene tetrahydromethanopterin reductase-like flavin-dependent oxidoreductase (luciferase family)
VLAGGRLRLGVGAGWNAIEFEALGASFGDRGARLEEQVQLLRELWTEDIVHFAGRWHVVDGAGVNPRPPTMIPIWMGGRAVAALQRAARIGDGWMCNLQPGEEVDAALAVIRDELAAHGRNPSAFGIAGRISLRRGVDEAVAAADRWGAAGVTHLAIDSSGLGLAGADAHADMLETVAALVAPVATS